PATIHLFVPKENCSYRGCHRADRPHRDSLSGEHHGLQGVLLTNQMLFREHALWPLDRGYQREPSSNRVSSSNLQCGRSSCIGAALGSGGVCQRLAQGEARPAAFPCTRTPKSEKAAPTSPPVEVPQLLDER